MSICNSILALIGSLAFLLFGMKLMSSGVQKSAGDKLQRTLGLITGNRFIGLLTGLLITMIIQSSGATTVMVVSFIDAGLITLTQSVGVIFGANIGTTITAWIVSLFGFNFKISAFAIPIFGLGFFFTYAKKANLRNMGEAIMGFGLLFLGLSGLADVFNIDPDSLGFLKDLQNMGVISLAIAFFIGIGITALMHSSSAFTAIVITMAVNKLITWEVAASMTFGSNIGSTIDAILASFGTSIDARRSALIHVLFNVFGTILAFVIFKPLLNFVTFITPNPDNIAIRISMLHTVFKLITTAVCIPFVPQIVSLAQIMMKDKGTTPLKNYHFDFQDHLGKENPSMHIIRLEKEIANMTDICTTMFDRLQYGFTEKHYKDFIKDHSEELKSEEEFCDQMHEQIIKYVVSCQKLSLTENQRNNLSIMAQVTTELESITDECYATGKIIERSVEKKLKFEKDDMDRLIPYVELGRQFLQFIHININKRLDANKLEMAKELEEQIDLFRKNLRKVARKRIENGADVKAELLYLDIVRRIEKIGDHAFSISELLTQTA